MLIEYEIPVRGTSGPHATKVHLTNEVVELACREGVPYVAQQTGVHVESLRVRLCNLFSQGIPHASPAQRRAKRSAPEADAPIDEAVKPREVSPQEPMPEVLAGGHRITEQDVKQCLRSLGDDEVARYERGELSKEEAFEMTRVWMKNAKLI